MQKISASAFFISGATIRPLVGLKDGQKQIPRPNQGKLDTRLSS